MAPPEGPTWLYQAYCEHQALLYVGIAVDLDRRLQQHRATKLWWPGVNYVVACQYPTRVEAAQVELNMIRGTLPPHNQAGKSLPSGPPSVSKNWLLTDRRGAVLERGA